MPDDLLAVAYALALLLLLGAGYFVALGRRARTREAASIKAGWAAAEVDPGKVPNRFLRTVRIIYPWVDGFGGVINVICLAAMLLFGWMISPITALLAAAVGFVGFFALHGRSTFAAATIISTVVAAGLGLLLFGTR